MFLPLALIGGLWNRSPFLSPNNVHFVIQVRKKRCGTMAHKCRPSDNAKKDDTAYTYAMFVDLL